MSHVHSPHTETLPSARARVKDRRDAAIKEMDRIGGEIGKLTAEVRDGNLGLADAMAAYHMLSIQAMKHQQQQDRIFQCDLAYFLLDAIKHGPDNPIVWDIPGRSQMQEQGPAEGVPHTGRPDQDGTLSSRAASEWGLFDTIARTVIRDQGLWVDADGNWHVASGGICMRPNPDGSLGN